MVRAFRQSGVGQVVLGVIVAAIILAFILTGNIPGGTSMGEECAVKVGSECVEPKEYEAAFRLMMSIGISEQAVKQLELRQKIARGLAEREVLIKRAKELGIGTSEEVIDQELVDGRTRVSLPADGAEQLALNLGMCVASQTGCEPGTIGLRKLRVGRDDEFDYEVYERTVRTITGRSSNQFKEMQQREYTAERMRQLIRSQVVVSEEEAFLTYSRARSKATARVAQVGTDWFLTFLARPTEEDVTAWKKDHQKELDAAAKELAKTWQPGCPVVSLVRLDDSADEEDFDAPKVLETLRRRLLVTKEWDMAARLSSAAPSATFGGRAGCLASSGEPSASELEAAAAKLEKEGDVSEVVETLRGPVIMRLDGRVTKENQLELATEHLAYEMAAQAMAEKQARAFAAKLIERLEGGEDIAEATEALVKSTLEGAPAVLADKAQQADNRPLSEISRPFGIEQSPIDNATGDRNVATLVFELKEDDAVLSEPVETRNGFAVLQLKEKDLLTREEFAEDRAEIMGQLRSRKAEQVLAQEVDDLLRKAGGASYDRTFVPDESEEGDDSSS